MRICLTVFFLLSLSSDLFAECNDGIDNDGDGLIDWQYDLGCYNENDSTEGGVASTEQDDGWTVFEPSVDTRIIYVSSSEGSDSYDGLTPATAKKTVVAGRGLLRRGFPDWLLFKRGDTWEEKLGLSATGRSATEPVVISSYGDSIARPLFRISSGTWMSNHGGSCGGSDTICGHVAILGLHAYMVSKNPQEDSFTGQGSAVVALLGEGGNYLFEDNKFEYGQFNIQITTSSMTEPTVVRRNSFEKNYSISSHAQNMFVGGNITWPLLIEENTFYHGGWSNEFRFVVTPGSTDVATWSAISDGRFDIVLAGENFSVENINFSGVSSMQEVAERIEVALNALVSPKSIQFNFSAGGVFFLVSEDFESDPGYKIESYSGSIPGTDIATSDFILGSNVGVPESTIFNRNLYLNGRGMLTLRGNVVADSSSGAQLRQGGLMEHNLFLRSSYQFNISGHTRYNVQLDSKNIDTQNQGGGFLVQVSPLGALGYSSLHHNVVAHNQSGTANIRGIQLVFQDEAVDIPVDIYKNIVYNWVDGVAATSGSGINLQYVSSDASQITIRDNLVQQPRAGTAVDMRYADSPVSFSNNTYFSEDPSSEWFKVGNEKLSLAGWTARTSETGAVAQKIVFSDPNRTIETYMDSIGIGGGYDEFIRRSLSQSRFSYDTRFMANTVNEYVREGFDMDLPAGVNYETPETGVILVGPPVNLRIVN